MTPPSPSRVPPPTPGGEGVDALPGPGGAAPVGTGTRDPFRAAVIAAAIGVVAALGLIAERAVVAADRPTAIAALGGLACVLLVGVALERRRRTAERAIGAILAEAIDALRAAAVGQGAPEAGAAPGAPHGHRDDEHPAETARRIVRLAVAASADRAGVIEQVEQARRSKAQFFGRLNHELRSPLSAILGYSTFLGDKPAITRDAEAANDLDCIRRAAAHLLDTIDDLVKLAELDGAGEAAQLRRFDLRALVGAVARDTARGADADEAAAALDGAPVVVVTDQDRAHRAIRNMLTVARDRERQGRKDGARGDAARPVLRLERDPAGGPCVTVRDRAGPPPGAMVARWSDPRADIASSRACPGEIAFLLARQLAVSIGGRIDLVPHADGLEQRLLLAHPDYPTGPHTMSQPTTPPAAPAPAVPATAPGSERILPAGDAAAPGPRTFAPAPLSGVGRCALIIDDDHAAVELLSRWVQKCGYRAIRAYNAEDGFALARQAMPDIILLDALMPGRSGYEILPEMRKVAHLRDTPIVIVTVDDDRLRGIQAGASDFVRKPLNEQALRDLVDVYQSGLGGDVLIVEDDDDAADLIARNLARLGMTTQRARDGVEALALLSAHRPSAIVLDLNMPRLDGFELINRIAASGSLSGDDPIPMLVVSGRDLDADEHGRLAAAGCRYFTKGLVAPREIAVALQELVA